MTKAERNNLIEWLVARTGYNPSYFESMKDESIEKLYEEIVVKG